MRSARVLCEGGVIGKRKYRCIQNSELALSKDSSLAFPPIMPYTISIEMVNTSNMGTLNKEPAITG